MVVEVADTGKKEKEMPLPGAFFEQRQQAPGYVPISRPRKRGRCACYLFLVLTICCFLATSIYFGIKSSRLHHALKHQRAMMCPPMRIMDLFPNGMDAIEGRHREGGYQGNWRPWRHHGGDRDHDGDRDEDGDHDGNDGMNAEGTPEMWQKMATKLAECIKVVEEDATLEEGVITFDINSETITINLKCAKSVMAKIMRNLWARGFGQIMN
uniref:uncharacterized protein LOC113474020 isoform X2 n=1 Tax=Ciona intestinalis TaxID=7719 RepID=UPI000EF49C44|nr:uncharacterized protein LOC113474020 isoform X2 [Ciona intestinalis]|eukprot:XP_026693569.1 uncharacterized protein LOC113474020 isoform X2 [Ciona intestinalis]